MIEQAASHSLPEWVETARGLTEPLKVEVVASSPLPAALPWVRNASRHGNRDIFHLAAAPLEGTRLGDLQSRCGWKFGHIRSMVAGCPPPLPREFFFVCKRCAKEPRLALYEEFSASMKGS